MALALDDLTPRQRNELVSLAGFPPMALDDEAAVELAALSLVAPTPESSYTTLWYRILPAGRDLLPEDQKKRLDETLRTLEARRVVFAKFGIP